MNFTLYYRDINTCISILKSLDVGKAAFIPKNHHYNANNKRKKGKKK